MLSHLRQPPAASTTATHIKELDVSTADGAEPMVRILDALGLLTPGHRLHVLIDRAPLPLYPILAANGYGHGLTARPDGRFEMAIWTLPRQRA